jgi:hypothetical protein
VKNKMDDLRDHLFETLEALKDKENPMDISRARAVSDVAGRLIDSAKVEVEFIKATGQTDGSQFMPKPRDQAALPAGRARNGA